MQGKIASLVQSVSCVFIVVTEWNTEPDSWICLGAKQTAAQERLILLIRSLAPTATVLMSGSLTKLQHKRVHSTAG